MMVIDAQKRGLGKTSTAVSLDAALARKEKSFLLIALYPIVVDHN